MNENTASKSAPKPEAPHIAELPKPSPESILREQLATSELEAAQLTAERDALSMRCAKLAEHRDALDAKVKELETNPFTFALANLDAGSVLDDAGKQMTKLAATVKRRQGKGTFTLKIAMKPFKGSVDALIFVPEVRIAEPAEEPHHAIFYAAEDGTISRNDPRQKEFVFSRGDRSATNDAKSYADEPAA